MKDLLPKAVFCSLIARLRHPSITAVLGAVPGDNPKLVS